MWNMRLLFLSWFSNTPEMSSQHSDLDPVTMRFQPMFTSFNSWKCELCNGANSLVNNGIVVPAWWPLNFHPFYMAQTHSWGTNQCCEFQCETWDFCSCLGSRTQQNWALSTANLVLWQWDSNPCSDRRIHRNGSFVVVRFPLWNVGFLSLFGCRTSQRYWVSGRRTWFGDHETSTHLKWSKLIAGDLISAVISNVKHGISVLVLVLEPPRNGLSAQRTWFCDVGIPTHVQISNSQKWKFCRGAISIVKRWIVSLFGFELPR